MKSVYTLSDSVTVFSFYASDGIDTLIYWSWPPTANESYLFIGEDPADPSPLLISKDLLTLLGLLSIELRCLPPNGDGGYNSK